MLKRGKSLNTSVNLSSLPVKGSVHALNNKIDLMLNYAPLNENLSDNISKDIRIPNLSTDGCKFSASLSDVP
jgi:hypothetical protein